MVEKRADDARRCRQQERPSASSTWAPCRPTRCDGRPGTADRSAVAVPGARDSVAAQGRPPAGGLSSRRLARAPARPGRRSGRGVGPPVGPRRILVRRTVTRPTSPPAHMAAKTTWTTSAGMLSQRSGEAMAWPNRTNAPAAISSP